MSFVKTLAVSISIAKIYEFLRRVLTINLIDANRHPTPS